jgi:hypothetical protein
MLSLERYTDLFNRRANGTLTGQELQDFNLLESKGLTAPLEPLRQNATPQLGTSQDRPGRGSNLDPTGSTADPTQLQVGQTPAPPPAFGPSSGELATLEAQRNPMNVPRSFDAERTEQQMLQRHATTTSPATVTPVSPPPTTTTVPPTTTAPPTTTTVQPTTPTTQMLQPAPPSSAAGAQVALPEAAAPSVAPAAASQAPAYPNVTGPSPEGGISAQEVLRQRTSEGGSADTGILWADRLGLPASKAEMPGSLYEGAERFASATPGDLAGALKEHPIRTPLAILGSPMNSIAAAAEATAQQFYEGQTPALIGDVAGIAAGLGAFPGMPGTGAFRAAPKVKQLEKVANVQGRAAAAAGAAEATKNLATKGLKTDPRKAITNFANHVEAARAAVSPQEMLQSLRRAAKVIENQFPGAKFASVEQIKQVIGKMEKLERTIGFRKWATTSGRRIMKTAAKGVAGLGVLQHLESRNTPQATRRNSKP